MLGEPRVKIEMLSTHNLHCRKLQLSVGKLQLLEPYFLNPRRRWLAASPKAKVIVSHCETFASRT